MKTSQDSLLDGSLVLEQPTSGYRIGFDPLLLSAFAPKLSQKANVLDLGCGVGGVFLSFAQRQPGMSVTALDREEEFCFLAKKNALLNEIPGCKILNQDIRSATDLFEPQSFDLVLADPPFYKRNSGRLSQDPKRAAAHHEIHGDLQDWLDCGNFLTKPNGHFCLIHLAARAEECLEELVSNFASIEWLQVKPKADRPANRVLIRASKQVPEKLRQLPDLTIHEQNGSLTEQASAIINSDAMLEF